MTNDIFAKPGKQKTDTLVAWLEAKPYWERYLWRLHLEKETLDSSDIEKCYRLLLEDYHVIPISTDRAPITYPPLNLLSSEIAGAKSTLDMIDNLKNVNAITDGCVIKFSKQLTIIYGDNGAGKSGIGRLLSNACNSRSPRKLLPNARSASRAARKATADFHLSSPSGSTLTRYTLGDTHGALKSFAVFDHECTPLYLDTENKVSFVPSKMRLFDAVFGSISAIEELLQREREAQEAENPTEGLFSDTTISTFLESLSHATTDKQLDRALKFTPADKALLEKKRKGLREKLRADVTKQKQVLRDECADLEMFKKALTKKVLILTKVKASQINALIKQIGIKKEIANKLSVKNFDFAAFKNVGSAEWKALIVAAHKLHEKETASHDGVEPNHCLLCRQPLTNKEKTLFSDYWQFLTSTAESELARTRRSLSASLDELEEADVNWPTFSKTETAVKVLTKDAPTDLITMKTCFDDLRAQLNEWITHIKKEIIVTYVDPKIDLNPISVLVTMKKEAEAKLISTAPEIRRLQNEIGYLEQKKQASGLLPKIRKYVSWLRWEHAVESINLPKVRGNTTRKKTEIMDELVISRYLDIFNEETEKLECQFGLRVESYGRDATTVKELKLDFAQGYNPSDILSEGEQTVSALADFLTEARLDKNNSGIVFDDPVSSLDHSRRTTIAKRLVEEAKDRQVIIFTHDIIFLLELQFYAENESVDHLSVSMRRIGEDVGVIKPELPWIALKVGAKVGYLKNELAKLKKAETGDPDEYRNRVKLWYELLRESWERVVEERLFKGVVQRFNKSVQTQKLDRVDTNPAIIKEITDGMSKSSTWLHDMAAGMNPAVPTHAKLAAELASIEDFISRCKPD